MMWPPRYCKKGAPNCVGPYMKRYKWIFNGDYDDMKKISSENMKYTMKWMDYEIGYDWTQANKYQNFGLHTGTFGYVEEYWNGTHCMSFVILPGCQLMSNSVLGIAYLIALGYLFLGVAIVSDIFMEAIETITSETYQVKLYSKDGRSEHTIEVPRWNETVANLTLMALGSSAPEILLSVI
jgi:hypothetical protein